ncbi:omega-hydroxypalmitate O-feruloyl transferase-like [Dendrobium catenatum]|uniref:omega-hydroxypalmitate O-feruloyl transferase-like n=1 Tax=Dendrobium catenatum TaxID=906689 RepID=UPI00109F1117|nr:omega-hydroxypalmitate O-feruloyl transferase-like [Dendrobium catenatum]
METALLSEENVRKEEPVTLVSPRNPTPTEILYLSNIDQTVAFNVETVFFYEVPEGAQADSSSIMELVKQAVSDVLLIPYYFMAGRLRFNFDEGRLELVCNNKGVLFVGAISNLELKELGNLSFPNPSFQHLILPTEGFHDLADTPIFSIQVICLLFFKTSSSSLGVSQVLKKSATKAETKCSDGFIISQVTRFRCGGFSVGFVVNHSILDGRSAAEMFLSLASICRGEGLQTHELNTDRSSIRARSPPQIKFKHTEYTKLAEASSTSFTSPILSSQAIRDPPRISNFRLFSFSPEMINHLKNKSELKCSSFEAVVAHLWRTRTKAVFDDQRKMSSVLFAVDIRSKLSPPLPHGFIGNAVITASASAEVEEMEKKSFSFCVGLVREAIDRVNDEYVRSVIDWLEVFKGLPCALNGNFFVSAWWKLPFHELDFGYGKPIYGGPVVSGMEEFVLLVSDESGMGKEKECGINVWIALHPEKMEKFQSYIFEI